MACRAAAAGLMVMSATSAWAQAPAAPTLRILGRHLISADNPNRPHFETHLAVDPTNPARRVAATMVLSGSGRLGSSIYYTTDGGHRWTRSVTTSAGRRMLVSIDPAVYFGREGTALFIAGGRGPDGRSTTFVSRSVDGGRTWSDPRLMPYRDRPWLGFDTAGKALDGTVYLAGQHGYLVLSRSYDDGRSFSWAELITRDLGGPDPNVPIRGVLADPVVTADGVLVLPFWGSGDPTDSVPDPQDTVNVGQLYLLASDDGGRTFRAARPGPLIRNLPTYRGVRATSAVRTAIDQSRGAHRGRLYAAWTGYDAGRYLVKLGRTDDLGKSWATTVVNDDTTGHDPSNVAVAVSRDGIVAVTWNDRRDDPRGNCFRLYGTISFDGGEHVRPNVRLSDAPVCPTAPANWQLAAEPQYDDWTDPLHPRPGFGVTAYVPVRFPNGGDTQGLVADREGIFHAAYIDGRSGGMQLWSLDFAVDSASIELVRAANATAASTADAAVPAGSVDVTQELGVAVSGPEIDFRAGTLTITMRVVNRAGPTVRGPVRVVVDQLVSPASQAMGLRGFRVANADSGGTGAGAGWLFQVPGDGVLARGERSLPRTLRFAFEGGMPREPEGYFEPRFRIYARSPGRSRP